MKKMASILAVVALTAIGAIVYAKSKTVITSKGSDTMVILAQRWAEKYMGKNPDITIQVTGGGSGVGISALINGTTELCNSSRPMKNSEREKLKQRFNTLGYEVKAAKDGVSVYLHESNPVKALSMAQIKAIYTAEITNWKDVGGPDAKIILYGRENSSGTYVYFRDVVVGGKDYAATMQTLPGTAAVVNAISKDKNGIGFGGAAYGKGIKFCAVKKDENSTAYEPNAENIKSGLYPVTRYLYIYLRSKPMGDTKNYIDWILSPEGQALVAAVGYFPVN